VNGHQLRDVLIVKTERPAITAPAQTLQCVRKPEDIPSDFVLKPIFRRG
jgi:hypothetical protein